MIKLNREFYTGGYELFLKEGEAEIYNKINNQSILKGFRSNRQVKPAFHYRFNSDNQRNEYVDTFMKNIREKQLRKQADRELKKSFTHDYEKGQIFFTSWGYDQTNVDFFQVVGRTQKTVKIQEIASRTVKDSEGMMCCYVEPVKNDFFGKNKPFNKVVDHKSKNLRGDIFSYYPYDGTPKYSSWYA